MKFLWLFLAKIVRVSKIEVKLIKIEFNEEFLASIDEISMNSF